MIKVNCPKLSKFISSRSLRPSELTSLLLDHALSFVPSTDTSFATLIKTCDHISRTHRSVLRQCVEEKVRVLVEGEGPEGGAGEGEREDKRFTGLFALLRIATNCQSLLDVTAEKVLKIGGL